MQTNVSNTTGTWAWRRHAAKNKTYIFTSTLHVPTYSNRLRIYLHIYIHISCIYIHNTDYIYILYTHTYTCGLGVYTHILTMCISCDIIAENDLYTQSRQQIQLIISWGLWVKTCFKSTFAQTCLQVVRADHSNDQELQQEAAASKASKYYVNYVHYVHYVHHVSWLHRNIQNIWMNVQCICRASRDLWVSFPMVAHRCPLSMTA